MVTAQQAIEWNHPLNRGLIYCGRLLPGSGNTPYAMINLATRRPPYLITGAATFTRSAFPWMSGPSLANNGSACAIKAENGEVNSLLSNALTACVLTIPTDVTTDTRTIAMNNGLGGTPFTLGFASGKLRCYSAGLPGSTISGNATCTVNTPYMIAFTLGAQFGGVLYLNGIADASTTYNGTSLGGVALELGANAGTSDAVRGTIAEVRLYKRELTAAEIMALYREAVSGNRRLYRDQAVVRASAAATTTKYSWWAWGTFGSV